MGFFANLFRNRTRRHEQWLRERAAASDMSAVSDLADALSLRDRRLRRIAEDGLIRLLPRLRPADAGLLNERQRKRLYGALFGENYTLALAIFQALEQVGNMNDYWRIRGLHNGIREARLKAAAYACETILEKRCWNGPETLLRSSFPPCAPAQSRRFPA